MRGTSAGWICSLCLCVPVECAAAEPARQTFDCDQPLNSAPREIKRVLGALYGADSSGPELLAASDELQQLASSATYCRVRVQSPSSGSDRSLAGEWIALHQWITRIADFLYLNAKGEYRVNWKDEYVEFAELYEFEL
jgi:hypothetical protein